ncbi:hypothetical protein D3Y57_14265 [Sphingomonas paeninsulae]|uniref:Uncharacterized protein n=1 Tax=Sphingomonas paeninsulae TaxID=2319844 RepID=A0A494TM62_SPHPE|nr:hypothetical protein [Sphingomonas paeninsulae]AYJ86891.1 hypothetical protein D3Y57_14265 [Sphingomonas paeninsulae]
MSGRILPMRTPHRDRHGTIHVQGDSVDGFTVSHESSSGSSWGELHGPFPLGQSAIAFAYGLNRDEHEGVCNISICDGAVRHASPDVGLVTLPGEF